MRPPVPGTEDWPATGAQLVCGLALHTRLYMRLLELWKYTVAGGKLEIAVACRNEAALVGLASATQACNTVNGTPFGWSPIGTLRITNLNGLTQIVDTNPPASDHRFYRAVSR